MVRVTLIVGRDSDYKVNGSSHIGFMMVVVVMLMVVMALVMVLARYWCVRC